MIRVISKLEPLSIEVIAPAHRPVEAIFNNVVEDPASYWRRLTQVQQFRGSVYVNEGFLRPDALDHEGRHVSPLDPDRWHLLVCDGDRHIKACLSLRLYDQAPAMHDLCAYELLERSTGRHLMRYTAAIGSLIDQSKRDRVMFGEVGGWAVSPDVRNGAATISTILGAWALMRFVGDAIWVATVGRGKKADRILSRMGGFRLPEGGNSLPPFFDAGYNSEIDILGFDSRRPCESAVEAIHSLRRRLMDSRFYAATEAKPGQVVPYDVSLRRRMVAARLRSAALEPVLHAAAG